MKMKLFLLLSVLTLSQLVIPAFKQETLWPKHSPGLVPIVVPIKPAKPEQQPLYVGQIPEKKWVPHPTKKSNIPVLTQDKQRKVKAFASIAAQALDLSVPQTNIENTPKTKRFIASQTINFQDCKERERSRELKAIEEEEKLLYSESEYDPAPPTKLQQIKTCIKKHPYKTGAVVVVVGGLVVAVIVAYKKGWFKNPFAKAEVKPIKKKKNRKKRK